MRTCSLRSSISSRSCFGTPIPGRSKFNRLSAFVFGSGRRTFRSPAADAFARPREWHVHPNWKKMSKSELSGCRNIVDTASCLLRMRSFSSVDVSSPAPPSIRCRPLDYVHTHNVPLIAATTHMHRPNYPSTAGHIYVHPPVYQIAKSGRTERTCFDRPTALYWNT